MREGNKMKGVTGTRSKRMMWWLNVVKKLDPIDTKLQNKTKGMLMLPIMFISVLLTPLFIIEAWLFNKNY